MIFFESIKEIPNGRRVLAQKYSLWATGVGSHIDLVRKNILQAYEFILNEKTTDALTFLQNAEMGIEAINQEQDFNVEELACYVKSIGDKEYKTLGERELSEIVSYINENMTQEEIEEKLSFIKKK
jgi:hypothetical protein